MVPLFLGSGSEIPVIFKNTVKNTVTVFFVTDHFNMMGWYVLVPFPEIPVNPVIFTVILKFVTLNSLDNN